MHKTHLLTHRCEHGWPEKVQLHKYTRRVIDKRHKHHLIWKSRWTVCVHIHR